jgi:hypothetical protein
MDVRASRFIVYDGEGEQDLGPYDGYTAGQTWNGWARPYFTREVADQLAALWNANPANGMSGTYDPATDSYTFRDPRSAMEPETFQGETHTDGGTPLHLYPIGNGSWVWDEVRPTVTRTAQALALQTYDAGRPLTFTDVDGHLLAEFRWGTNADKTRLNLGVVAYTRDGEAQVCHPTATFTIVEEPC